MGEAPGLAPLAAVAPVVGVRGADDEDNPYTSGKTRRIEVDGLVIGCAFDPIETGIASAANPLTLAPEATLGRIFGGMPNVLLWASTHVPSVERIGRRL